MSLDNQTIQKKLVDTFGLDIIEFHESHDILTFEINSKKNHEIIKYLKEDKDLNFNFLTDVCGVHFPDYEKNRQFAVVYHLHNWYKNVRIRIKCFTSTDNPNVDSVVDLYKSANWQERETYDFYGIKFNNHPQMKRILNMDEMESFPLRKEFPMEDQGRTDKDDRFFGRIPNNC